MEKIGNVPQITINGKPVDTSAIDDYDGFMGFIMQASAAANIAKLKKYAEDQQSKGHVFSLPLNIGPVPEQQIQCPEPLQTLYIENTGAAQIFVAINSLSSPATPIPAGREALFSFKNHVLELFYVWTAPGTVSTATAILSY